MDGKDATGKAGGMNVRASYEQKETQQLKIRIPVRHEGAWPDLHVAPQVGTLCL